MISYALWLPSLRILSISRTIGRSLRAYTKVFLNFFPIIFGPYFAFVGDEYGLVFGLTLAVIYGLVLTSLDNIQEDLEDPFDGIGSDDIALKFPTMLEPGSLDNEYLVFLKYPKYIDHVQASVYLNITTNLKEYLRQENSYGFLDRNLN